MARRPVLIIAHRGGSAVAPESTRAAIRAAAQARAHMVELDIQMTRDRRLIIFHDERLERTTNGSGRVAKATYARLARLDAGSWFDRRFAGERILLASQAIRLVPRTMRINLELKRTARRRALVRRVARLIRPARLRRRLLLSSFDASLLTPLRRHGLRIGLICRREPDRSLRQAIRLGCASWHPFHTLVSRRRLARAHAAGVRVYAWVVERRPRAKRLIRMGVDGIFTNNPARLRGVRA